MAEAGIQFDGFLESLKVALEDKEDHSPYLEIIRDTKPSNSSILSERIVVVKDDTMKNIVLRTSGSPVEKVQEDEDLNSMLETKSDHDEENTYVPDVIDEENVPDDDEEEEEEEDVEEFELNGQRYYLAPESKRVFKYIDENTPGDQVGKLMNGHLVSSSNFVHPK